jgi:monofunctional biosynthetic peptidoglycan transglycosylase
MANASRFASSSKPGASTLVLQVWSKAKVVLKIVKGIFLAYAVAFSVAGTLLLGLAAYKAWSLYDSVAGLADRWPEKTAMMELRERQWKDSGIVVETRWKPVPLSKISENLRKTVLVGEDDKFYNHNGFDMDAIQNALAEAKEKGKVKRGASTITQQLAKNLYLSPKRSFSRKAQEALYTLALEHFLSKDRIFELYLNVIEWGRGVYGAEAASQTFFGVSASELDLDQAARLAAVLPKPLKVSPIGANRFMLNRKAAILQNLKLFRGFGPGNDTTKTEESDDEAEVEDDSASVIAPIVDTAKAAPEAAPTEFVKSAVDSTR